MKKEDQKAKCFKTMLENGKKFVQQANEVLLRMKLTKAQMVLKPSLGDERMAMEEGRPDMYERMGDY